MIKNYFFLISLMAFSGIQAQETKAEVYYDPYTPEYFVGEGPKWLQDIRKAPSKVNYFEMEKKFQEWLSEDSEARVKTVEKKPAVNFYRRWQKAYAPYVDAQGNIVLPKRDAYIKQKELKNQALAKGTQNLALTATGQAVQWRNIGPNTTARNDQYRGFVASYPYQANVFRIDIAETNPNILYCGAETGVVFKTLDKGKTWQACSPTYDFGANITAIKINPKNENEVWVGSNRGLYYSFDGGNTFNRAAGIYGRVNSIRISDNYITAGADSGFYFSDNKGVSFKETYDGECNDHELKPGAENIVYLLAKKTTAGFKFLISKDYGKTFTEEVSIVPEVVEAGRLAVSKAPGGENYVYALINIKDIAYGRSHIFKSVDAGQTWQDQTVRTGDRYEWKNTFCPAVDGRAGGQGYYDMMIGVSNKNPEHVIFGLCSSYRSLRGGLGGYKENAIGGYCEPKMHADMQDIAINGDEVWIANDGGIQYSNDFFKEHRENRSKGIYASDYHGFGQGWNEDVMIGGRWHNGDAVMMKKYGEGNSVMLGGVEKATGYVMLSNPRKVYASDAGFHIMPDKIDGKLISEYEKFLYKKPYEVLRNHGFLATDPRYANRILFNSELIQERDQVWETKDEGLSYDFLHKIDEDGFSNIEFARSNPDVIYICGVFNNYVSKDNGKTWKTLPQISKDAGLVYSNFTLPSYLAVHPKDENHLWISQPFTKGALAFSKDGGYTWTSAVKGTRLENKNLRWIILVGDEKNGVYVSTDDGAYVYYKDDDLPDWVDYYAGLPTGSRLTKLVPFYKEGKLRAATSQGIWEVPLYKTDFEPTAQPMALNLSKARLDNANMEVQFDSYSIVNQENATWEWSFSPKPYSVSNPKARNPKVVFKYNGEYDVTLKVTTPAGTHTRTIKKMIIVDNGTLSTTEGQANKDVVEVYPSLLKEGEAIRFKFNTAQKDWKFYIYDTRGVLVKQANIEALQTGEISTQGLPKGAYLYQISNSKHKKFGKFIIQ